MQCTIAGHAWRLACGAPNMHGSVCRLVASGPGGCPAGGRTGGGGRQPAEAGVSEGDSAGRLRRPPPLSPRCRGAPPRKRGGRILAPQSWGAVRPEAGRGGGGAAARRGRRLRWQCRRAPPRRPPLRPAGAGHLPASGEGERLSLPRGDAATSRSPSRIRPRSSPRYRDSPRTPRADAADEGTGELQDRVLLVVVIGLREAPFPD